MMATHTQPPDNDGPRRVWDLPPAARVIVCIGPFLAHGGVKDALWAFDILKYLDDDLYLLVIGDGPDRDRLEQFARDIQIIDRVRFLDRSARIADALLRAHVIWLCGPSDGILDLLSQAMAAGRGMVAVRVPGIAEILTEGEAVCFVPRGDKVALARRTRRFLEDPNLLPRALEGSHAGLSGH